MIETAKHLTMLKDRATVAKELRKDLYFDYNLAELDETNAWDAYHNFRRDAIKEMEGEVEIVHHNGDITVIGLK